MSQRLGVGLALPPDPVSLALLWPLIQEEADYYEVTPETLWRRRPDGALAGNGYRARFLALKAETGRPFVAHGVGLSMLGCSPERRAAWLAQIAADAADFGFEWYTDHLGWTEVDGQDLALPLPAPWTPQTRAALVQTLRQVQAIVPAAGLENSVSYLLPHDPLDEPAEIAAALAACGGWLLLDLHNLHTMACNFGFDPADWLERAPLGRVIAIHLSGGKDSPPRWLPGGRIMRLDSHDSAVPEPVWALLGAVLPRCPALRGVTLERMEGTFTAEDVPLLRGELRRIRAALAVAP